MNWDVGDTASLDQFRVTNTAGVLTNATVTVTVTKPDGTTTSPTPVNTATGLYDASVVIDQAGQWTWLWVASGAVVSKEPGQLTAVAPRVLVADFAELKQQLNRTDIADDAELRTYLVSATNYVEYRLGGPVSVQTFTERHFVTGDTIIPRRRPLVSITSITPDFGTALSSSSYTADTDVNQILFYYLTSQAWHTVVYKAGYAVMPENAKLAGLIVAQHLYETQNGFGGRRNSDDLVQTGLGFAVPRRAEELLGAVPILPGIS